MEGAFGSMNWVGHGLNMHALILHAIHGHRGFIIFGSIP
jgi:hypothetical protein